MNPLVSIITPSLNQARFIPFAIRSIQAQTYAPIEHIVVDGGSIDGTLAILQDTQNIVWTSAPDGGQVEALEKGFKKARGEILAWLNADDVFYPDTVECAVEAMRSTGADLVYGDLDIIDENGKWLRTFRGIPFDFRVLLYGINYIGQQTVFFRRQLWEKVGYIRSDLNNAFDYELWLRMVQYGRFVYVPKLRAQIRHHPAAKSFRCARITAEETVRIRSEYWDRGGWPRLFANPCLFWIPHLMYRLKRQFILLRSNEHTKGSSSNPGHAS